MAVVGEEVQGSDRLICWSISVDESGSNMCADSGMVLLVGPLSLEQCLVDIWL